MNKRAARNKEEKKKTHTHTKKTEKGNKSKISTNDINNMVPVSYLEPNACQDSSSQKKN
jgi:hypothetical protein